MASDYGSSGDSEGAYGARGVDQDQYGQSQDQDQPRKKTSLIINYLPQSFLDKDLRDLFSSCGALENVRVMRDRQSGYSFGYGFVNYVNEEDAAKAIQALDGYQAAENKTIKVSYARPPSDDIKDTNVYITNLPRDLTVDELVKMFSPFGDIVQKNLLYDKYTGLSRGVAFVRYDRREQAATAIDSMNDFIPLNAQEPLRVKLAENHGKQKAAYVQGFQSGYQQSQPRQRYYNQEYSSQSQSHGSNSSHYQYQ